MDHDLEPWPHGPSRHLGDGIMASMKAALVLATQQFENHPAFDDPEVDLILMIESDAAFRRRPYHSHKIVLLLSAMRHTADRLQRAGTRVERIALTEGLGFIEGLRRLVREHDIDGSPG